MTNKYPVPANEQERLKALLNYNILDTMPDEQLDAITRIASYICKTPIALITLIDKDRQWIKSKVGSEIQETSRKVSFCQHTVMGTELLEIPDTYEDERLSDNPFVTDGMKLRFYAGMPLINPDGLSIGSLCVVDDVPRHLTDEQKDILKTLSREIITHLELRKTNANLQGKINELVTDRIEKTEADLNTYQFALNQFASVCITNLTGEITMANKNFCNITGLTLNELTGKYVGNAISNNFPETFYAEVREAVLKGEIWHGEVEGKHKSGNIYWTDTVVIPYINKHKQPYQFMVILQDITDKKKADDTLSKLAKVQQGILNGTDYAIIHVEPSGLIKTFNSGAEKMLGYKAEEMVGIHNPGVFHDHEEIEKRTLELNNELGINLTPGFETFVAKANKGIVDTNEWTFIRKDQSRITVLLSVSTLRDNEGNILGHLGIARDITESIQSRSQVKLFEEIVRNMTTGLLVWQLEEVNNNDDFRLIMTNDAAINTLPERKDYTGGIMTEVFPSTKQSPMLDMYKGIVSNNQPIQIPEYKASISIPEQHYYSITAFPLQNKRVGVLFHDITTLKHIEAELREAKSLAEQSMLAKDQFLANMSHEIRTPMNAIVGFTDLLLQTNTNSEQKEYLDSVKLAGENLLGIINDILDFSKIESGKLSIEDRPFKLKPMLQHIYSLLNIKAMDKLLGFNINLDLELPEVVSGDSLRLQQVLINLAGNAIKFTEKGQVDIAAKVISKNNQHYTIRFSVKDSGIGIKDEMKSLVFERFTQANNEIHRQYGGTGLGLSISRNLIQLMGGELQMNSEFGKGSEFYFELNFKKVDDVGIKKLDKILNFNLPVKKVHVLLFEDNTLNQQLAKKVLSKFGFEITLAENGKIGIDKLKEQSFDIILMDLQMPEIDGYQATEIIRNELKLKTPIIAMTAHSLVGEKEKCIAVGMDDFISKPFKQEDLYEVLTNLLPESFFDTEHSVTAPIVSEEKTASVDLSYLKDISGDDKEFEKNMLNVFLEEVPIDMAQLKIAFDTNDTAKIWKTAHKLKSSMSVGGQTDLIPLLAVIEQEARHTGLTTESLDNYTKIMDQLTKAYEAITIILTQKYK
ncbi:MAG: PAS domain-containing protein [Bacteroidota bacterium]